MPELQAARDGYWLWMRPLIGDHHGTSSIGAPVEDTISALHVITHGMISVYGGLRRGPVDLVVLAVAGRRAATR